MYDLFAPCRRLVLAPWRAGVELARAADSLVRLLDHLLPLGNPADGARERKQHREHGGGKANGAQRNAGIEVDVGVKPLLDEILVAERDTFELYRDIEQWIFDAKLAQHLVTGSLHDLGARIIVLVDTVT